MCSIMETFGHNCYFDWILTNLPINSMAAFEIRGHKPEWGILDHYLLLLGEPSMGLAPILVNQIFNITRDINQQGISILLWE